MVKRNVIKRVLLILTILQKERKLHLKLEKKGIVKRKSRLADWNKNDEFKTCVDKSLEVRGMAGLNHKVVSIEWLTETVDTGDITVEKYHNFSLASGIIVSNSALSEENIAVSKNFVNHQKYLAHQMQELMLKIYQVLDPEKALTILDDVIVAFPTPKSLQFERESKYMGDLAGLVETLERIGIPKEYSKKRYLTRA